MNERRSSLDDSPREAPSLILHVREAVESICNHPNFESSPKSRQLLRYLVDSTIANPSLCLTEGVIAAQLYRKGPGMEPVRSSFVRTQVYKLRQKLQAYYDGPGRYDSVTISLAPGKYNPSFETGSGKPRRSRGFMVGDHPLVWIDAPTFPDSARTLPLVRHLRDSLISGGAVRLMSDFLFDSPLVGDVQPGAKQVPEQAEILLRVEEQSQDTSPSLRVNIINMLEACHLGIVEIDLGDLRTDAQLARAAAYEIENLVDSKRPTHSTSPEDPAVAGLCKQGEFFLSRLTLDSSLRAAQFFKAAIAASPNCADAWASFALATVFASLLGGPNGRTVRAEASGAALRAMFLSPDAELSLTAWAAVAGILEWNSSGPEALERIVARCPDFPWGWVVLLLGFRCPRGHLAVAVEEAEEAISECPTSVPVLYAAAVTFYLSGNYARALEQYDRIEALVGPHAPSALGKALLCFERVGESDSVRAQLRIAEQLSGPSPSGLALEAILLRDEGRLDGLSQLEEKLSSLASHLRSCETERGIVEAMRRGGTPELHFERAIRLKEPSALFRGVHPLLRSLKGALSVEGLWESVCKTGRDAGREVPERRLLRTV